MSAGTRRRAGVTRQARGHVGSPEAPPCQLRPPRARRRWRGARGPWPRRAQRREPGRSTSRRRPGTRAAGRTRCSSRSPGRPRRSPRRGRRRGRGERRPGGPPARETGVRCESRGGDTSRGHRSLPTNLKRRSGGARCAVRSRTSGVGRVPDWAASSCCGNAEAPAAFVWHMPSSAMPAPSPALLSDPLVTDSSGDGAAGAPPEALSQATLGVQGMTCAACSGRVEKALERGAGRPPRRRSTWRPSAPRSSSTRARRRRWRWRRPCRRRATTCGPRRSASPSAG